MEEKKRSTIQRDKPAHRIVDKNRIKDDAKQLGKEYVFPKIKRALQEAASNVADVLIFGQVRNGGNGRSFTVMDFTNRNNNSTNYNARYSGTYNAQPAQPMGYLAGSAAWKFEDVVFTTPEEATEVWYQLHDWIAQNGSLDVNRYYDICQADVKVPYTYTNYGWTNIGDKPQILAKNFNGDAMYIIAMPNIRYVGGR